MCCVLRATVVLQAACDSGAAGYVRPWCYRLRGCVRTHQVRSNALWQDLHFKSTFLPFVSHVCCNDLQNTKCLKLYKILVINVAKSLTNISKGGLIINI
jgi:hypothetical protein